MPGRWRASTAPRSTSTRIPRLGEHQDWGTHIFNYGRNEVKSFLLSSAHYWLSEFHIDGLRVDAVASMLYLDYSRKAGEWLPNRYGGRENLEAIEFLRALNVHGASRFPRRAHHRRGIHRLADGVAPDLRRRPGLLDEVEHGLDERHARLHRSTIPIHRRYHHDKLTFGQLYAYTENFLLPLSHDEVVHGKGSLLGKMPGDAWQKFANLRLLLAYQATSPGQEAHCSWATSSARAASGASSGELDWGLLGSDWHRGMQACVRDLNRLYRDTARAA